MKNTFEDGSETSEVKRQLEHSQRLLRSFTSAFDALFDDNGQSDFMDRILKVINEQFDASYTLYLRFEPEKHAFFIDRVYAPGPCVPPIDTKKPYPVSAFENSMADILTTGIFVNDLTDPLQKERYPEWARFADRDIIKSFVLSSVRVGDSVIGAVGVFFREPRLDTSPQDFRLLSVAAHTIETIMRLRAHQKMIHGAQCERERAAAAKERQVASISAGLDVFFSQRLTGDSVHALLEVVRSHYNAARVCVVRYEPDKGRRSILFQVSAEGHNPLTGPDVYVPIKNKAAIEKLDRDGIFVFENPRDISQLRMMSDWYDLMDKVQCRSILMAKVNFEGKFWGALSVAFEAEMSESCEGDPDFLRISANLVGALLSRHHYQQEMEDTRLRLSKTLEAAEAARKAKSYFVSTMSHEIRTPLNAVIGFAELLKDHDLSPDRRDEYLEAVSFSSNALMQLINDVLDLSKLEADKTEIIPEATEIRMLCDEVYHVFLYKARNTSLEIRVDCEDMPQLMLDRLRMRQILLNIVGNAVKFTHHGSVTIAAQFAPKKGGKAGTLTFAVSDTGIGISKEDLEKLGRPFVQGASMRDASFGNGGTGLGLAICMRLIARMQGKLKIKSEVGKGSTFTVKIPVKVAGNEIVSECKIPPAGPAEPVRSDLSVLLVDDVKINRMVLAAQFHKLGIKNVLQSASGEEAMEMLRHEHVDVVFSDLWMPGMSGCQLCDKIRENHMWDRIPMVAVTADVEAQSVLSKSRFDHILIKPIKLESIRDVFSKLSLMSKDLSSPT